MRELGCRTALRAMCYLCSVRRGFCIRRLTIMTYHVLNGSALVKPFLEAGLNGIYVVARECLIEGDLSGDTPEAFYRTRANYLQQYGERPEHYFQAVVRQWEILTRAPDRSTFHLWFGYDLFCQANMWFVLSLLYDLPIRKQVYAVYPSWRKGAEVWLEFGRASTDDMLFAFEHRVLFSEDDLQLGKDLWQAYKRNDLVTLKKLSAQPSAAFPYLREVCQAHIDRFPPPGAKSRPEKLVGELLQGPRKDFPYIFSEFSKREGIYGFGDLQFKNIYDKLRREAE